MSEIRKFSYRDVGFTLHPSEGWRFDDVAPGDEFWSNYFTEEGLMELRREEVDVLTLHVIHEAIDRAIARNPVEPRGQMF